MAKYDRYEQGKYLLTSSDHNIPGGYKRPGDRKKKKDESVDIGDLSVDIGTNLHDLTRAVVNTTTANLDLKMPREMMNEMMNVVSSAREASQALRGLNAQGGVVDEWSSHKPKAPLRSRPRMKTELTREHDTGLGDHERNLLLDLLGSLREAAYEIANERADSKNRMSAMRPVDPREELPEAYATAIRLAEEFLLGAPASPPARSKFKFKLNLVNAADSMPDEDLEYIKESLGVIDEA